jgi:hypothetical protein
LHGLLAKPMGVVVRPLDNPRIDGWWRRGERGAATG